MPVAVPHADGDDAARRTTRRISAMPAGASLMNVTTSWASAASNDSSGHGSSSAGAARTSMPGKPPLERRDERRRRVGGGRLGAAPAELGGQRAGAGADVEHALAGVDPGEIGEERREPHGVAAHEVVVGGVRDVEHRPEYSR